MNISFVISTDKKIKRMGQRREGFFRCCCVRKRKKKITSKSKAGQSCVLFVRKKKKIRSPVEGEKVSQVRGDVYMSSGEAAGREMMNVERSEVRGINLFFSR
jgi:hypothetical protein